MRKVISARTIARGLFGLNFGPLQWRWSEGGQEGADTETQSFSWGRPGESLECRPRAWTSFSPQSVGFLCECDETLELSPDKCICPCR